MQPPPFGPHVTSVPEVLKIETTDRCNALCIMCGHTFYPKDKLGDMSFDDVKMLIAQASHWKPKPLIQLDLIGEALLYPHTVEAVAYAHSLGLKTRIYTNGQLLTREMMIRLMKAGLNWFSVTIDGFTKETYEKIRVGLNFDVVKKNICDAWELCRRSKTHMEVGMVLVKENVHERDKIRAFWKPRCHKFFVNHEIGGIDPEGKCQPARVGAVIPRGLYQHCMAWTPWTQLAVRVNGCVPFCTKMFRWGCNPFMGNAFDKPMLEIYNSSYWDELRTRVVKRVNLPYQCKLLCHGF